VPDARTTHRFSADRRPDGRREAGRASAGLVDFLFLLRPTALVPAWIFVARGAVLAAQGGPFVSVLPSGPVGLALAGMTAVLGGGYILNQITDIETDRRNEKLFLLPRGIIAVRAAAALMVALWIAAGAAATFLPSGARWALAAGLVLAVTYSAPRVRAKAVPGLDLLWNGLGFGAVSPAAGWFAAGGHGVFPVWAVAGYTLAVGALIASTTIPDIAGDREAGLRTTGVALGERRTGLLASGLMALAVALAALARDAAGASAAAVGFILLVRAQRAMSRRARVEAAQWTVAAYVVAVGLRAPYLIVLLALVFAASRMYYRRRFGIDYPGRGTP